MSAIQLYLGQKRRRTSAKMQELLERAGSTTSTRWSSSFSVSSLVQRVRSEDSLTGSENSSWDEVLDKYELGRVIGIGTFGQVYSCSRKGTQEEFAMKAINVRRMPLVEIRKETEMLQAMAHPCIVKLHEVYFGDESAYLIMDIYKGGDLVVGAQRHWSSKGMLPIPVVQNISKMIVQAVDWLHDHSVVHRDLKLDNFVMGRGEIEHPECRIFLSDFGLARKLQPQERLNRQCGTPEYWAPEVYDGSYHIAVDMWAVGVMVFGLISSHSAFKNEHECRTKAVQCPAQTTRDGRYFIQAALERDESKRLTARQALAHAFLKSAKPIAQSSSISSRALQASGLICSCTR